MNSSERKSGQSQPFPIVGECTSSNFSKDNNYLCEDSSIASESEFERRWDTDTDINDQNVGDILRECVFVKRSRDSILRRCVEYLNSANNENTIPNVFDTFVSVCEDGSMFDLMKPLSKYIVKHIDRYVDDKKFLEASHHTLTMLFRHGHTECSSENDRFGAFTLLTRWVSYNYDERKQYFDELLKMSNGTKLLPNYHITEPMKHQDDHEKNHTKTDILNNNELMKDEMRELHVFVRYREKMKVFSRKSAEWSLTDELSHKYPSIMQNVAIGDKLYRLEHNQIFSVGHSARLMLDRHLEFPPPMRSSDLCVLRNNIYLHGGSVDTDRFERRKNRYETWKKFNEKELMRGIFGYNCDLDMWYSLPAPNFTQVDRGYLATADHRMLYLIGEEKGTNLAQRYDLRVDEWHKLSKPSFLSKVAGCVMHQGKLHVAGSDEKGAVYVEVYDPIAEKWDHNVQLVFSQRGDSSNFYKNAKIVLYHDELCIISTVAQGCLGTPLDWRYDSNLSKWYSSPSLSAAIIKHYPEVDLSKVSILDAVVF